MRWKQRQEGSGAASGANSLTMDMRSLDLAAAVVGFLHIAGNFYPEHRDEVTKLMRHHEARARAEHALERIMAIDEVENLLRVHWRR